MRAAIEIEKSVLFAVEGQLALLRSLGDYSWHYDIDFGSGQITFRDTTTGRVIQSGAIQLVGTQSLVSNTWLWAWANLSPDDSPQISKSVVALRDHAASVGQPWNVSHPIPIANHLDPVYFTLYCMALSGGLTWFACPNENGQGNVYLIIENLEPPLGVTRDALTASTTIEQAINVLAFNHRAAMIAYLGEGTSVDNAIEWQLGDGAIRARFDDFDRNIEFETDIPEANH
jgi:hypothetical protein